MELKDLLQPTAAYPPGGHAYYADVSRIKDRKTPWFFIQLK
jgi:hypothetical protein